MRCEIDGGVDIVNGLSLERMNDIVLWPGTVRSIGCMGMMVQPRKVTKSDHSQIGCGNECTAISTSKGLGQKKLLPINEEHK
jgi:hypothetical protein